MIAAVSNQGVLENPVALMALAVGIWFLGMRLLRWADVDDDPVPVDHHLPDPPATVRVIRPPFDWSAHDGI